MRLLSIGPLLEPPPLELAIAKVSSIEGHMNEETNEWEERNEEGNEEGEGQREDEDGFDISSFE
ncbi:hypothetical protein DEO72_LG5g1277 [Vigna unguiculata]|uniref:Uncharacterized protein n=1 Tax=Vigna unguiculata TaxID=3917 RepID=A0A4D6LX06_VIGUN|nr:hypothetical protein DEO72_LG5g1277 [Vigna unguiculata]